MAQPVIRVGLVPQERLRIVARQNMAVSDSQGRVLARLGEGDECEVLPLKDATIRKTGVNPGPPGEARDAGLGPMPRKIYLVAPHRGEEVREIFLGGGEVLLRTGGREFGAESLRFPGPITLRDTLVGRGFPWERQEDADFPGETEVIAWDGGRVRPVNIVRTEDYIASVVSSEIGADAPEEAQKAQAIAARSTLLATYGSHHIGPFGICNEDHCQVYRGLRVITPKAQKACLATEAMVMVWGDEVVDARFSKCCGGITEEFSGAWGPRDVPYLVSKPDGPYALELSDEEDLRDYIDQPPPALCGKSPNFRWEEMIPEDVLSERIRRNTGRDIGRILEIKALARAKSGRITRLSIRGERGELEPGPELEIRRVLSDTYLPSSCFYVVRQGRGFLLRGAGWGHGVGMCQEGAKAQARGGANFGEILSFYYPGTRIIKY